MAFRLWSTGVLLAMSLAAVEATKSLQLKIDGPTDISGVDDFYCVTTLTNTGDEPLKLYNEPRGVLNPIATQSFKVAKANGNGAAAFHGLVAKYSFKQATSFTELAPGGSVEIQHDLSKAYSFEATGTGAYTVSPTDARFFYQDPVTLDAVPIIADVVNDSHTAKLSGSLKSRAVERRLKRHAQSRRSAEKQSRSLHKRAIQITNCASTLKDDVTLSAQVASLYIADAEKQLTLVPGATSERYQTWFGVMDQSNHDRVLQHYTNIRQSDLKTYTFDCECTEGSDVFAYVFPDEFGHIHLCNQYIVANVSGTDSKAGTLVHESTHFTKNGGTKDLAYGKTKAMALAVSNSTAATMNADSHEYFAENAPALA